MFVGHGHIGQRIRHIPGSREGLLRLILRTPLLPPGPTVGERHRKIGGHGCLIAADPFDHGRVPVGVELRGDVVASEQHEDVVAASVVVVGRVERLVQIAGEVQQRLERENTLRFGGVGIGEFGGELSDLVEDTVLRRTSDIRWAR